MMKHATKQSGITLLEMLVAFAIMAMSLGLIYQIMGSNLKTSAVMESYQRASILAQSLLNAQDGIPESGWNESGESGGINWQVRSQPFPTPAQSQSPQAVPLHELEISVTWVEDNKPRSIVLHTLRPQLMQTGVPR